MLSAVTTPEVLGATAVVLSAAAILTARATRPPPPAQHANSDFAAPWHRAGERALETLLEHLNERQRAEYEHQLAFTVVASSGNTYYLSRNEVIAKIGRQVFRLCIQPSTTEAIPAWDVVLARKLLIEADEAAFLATAKRWPWPNIYG
ncbi:hypothetical protein EPN52_10550 [bacterium]|nr:MAG: hypothetical protein EPN52_10550 [bacterium]